MDKFKDVVRNNLYSFEFCKSRIISNDRGNRGKSHYSLKLSYDKFYNFLLKQENIVKDTPYFIDIYDEDIIGDKVDIKSRLRLLNNLKDLNIEGINFYLSNSTLPLYNLIMDRIGWKHESATHIYLTIDRNPKSSKNNLNLELTKGNLILPEEKLLWVSDDILQKLQGKVDIETLRNAYKLKDVVKEFYDFIDNLFYVNQFTDYDKVVVAYEYVKSILRIKFPIRYVTNINGKEELINPHPRYISEPFGTYLNKEGVCEGQARLIRVLLNNYFMKIDATTIGGRCNLGLHEWVGAVIDDKLYECCPTMLGPFKDLSSNGYIPDDEEVYPKIYKRNYLTNEQINNVEKHIKELRKN